MTPLRIAVRRSLAAWMFPVLLVLSGLNISEVGSGVFSEWRAAVASASTVMVLTLPLIAATAAADSLRYRRSGGESLVRGTRAQPWFHALRALAVWLWFLAAHLVALGVHWVLAVRAHGHVGLFDPWIALSSTVVLAAGACLGVMIGWLFPRFVTPPALAIALYVLPAYSGLLTSRHALMYSGVVEFPAEHVDPGVQSAQVTWFCLVAATSVAFLARPSRMRVVTVAALIVASIGAYTWVARAAEGPYFVPDAQLPPLHCVDGAPRVCLFAESPAQSSTQDAPAVAAMVTGIAAAIARIYPEVAMPAVIVPAQAQTLPPGAAVVRMSVAAPHLAPDQAVIDLPLRVAGCADEAQRCSVRWGRGDRA